jgi:hypothetical protein
MINTRDETGYILKHETGKYFSMTDSAPLGFDHLTDDPVKATRFPVRELAESAIKRNKEMDRSTIRWNSEMALIETISDCTVKEIKIHTEYEVEE